MVLAGCGGGGGGEGNNDANNDAVPTNTTITGVAIAGAVDGNVSVQDASGSTLATATVAQGNFTLAIPDFALARELDFIVTGQYTDEISDTPVALTAAHPLALRTVPGYFTAGQTGKAPITPDSTVIRALIAEQGLTLAEAHVFFNQAMGYQPEMSAIPFDPLKTDSTAAADRPPVDQEAAFRVGTFSQLASDLGLKGDNIALLPTLLAQDLSDGNLDGVDRTGKAVTANELNLQQSHQEQALPFALLKAHAGFMGSMANHAALKAPSAGLPTVSYDPVGAQKIVTTTKGRHLTVTLDTVADAPFKSGFWTARVRHRLTVVDTDTHQPVDITSDPDIMGVSNHPMMYMLSGHTHSTPHAHDPNLDGKAQGQYVLDNYYVMASAMANGTPMGVWDYVCYIKEDTDGDRATSEASTAVTFHPQVLMTMGSEVFSVTASNSADQWTNMGMNQARPYRLWLHEIVANSSGGHDLTVFVSTQNLANPDPNAAHQSHGPSFPGVYSGLIMQGILDTTTEKRPDVTVNSVTVELSTDQGATWNPLTADGTSGRYRINQLTGLQSAASNILQLRLTVNGQVMATANGTMPELQFTAP